MTMHAVHSQLRDLRARAGLSGRREWDRYVRDLIGRVPAAYGPGALSVIEVGRILTDLHRRVDVEHDASARAADDASRTTTVPEPRCPWCGVAEANCFNLFDHRRLAAGSEVTFWRTA